MCRSVNSNQLLRSKLQIYKVGPKRGSHFLDPICANHEVVPKYYATFPALLPLAGQVHKEKAYLVYFWIFSIVIFPILSSLTGIQKGTFCMK